MGQFQSKEYDGDPYVDLMRALPERELIWWVQKAIWVSFHEWASACERWRQQCALWCRAWVLALLSAAAAAQHCAHNPAGRYTAWGSRFEQAGSCATANGVNILMRVSPPRTDARRLAVNGGGLNTHTRHPALSTANSSWPWNQQIASWESGAPTLSTPRSHTHTACNHHPHTTFPHCLKLQLVEGFTFVDHFRRTYPSLFVYKCQVGRGVFFLVFAPD